MGFPATVVLGASGRIGAVLRAYWPQILPAGSPLRWQARRRPPQAGPENQPENQPESRPEFGPEGGPPPPLDWRLCDPLADPEGLARAAQGCPVVLCLAGVIPGQGDMADNIRLGLAAVQAAAPGAAVLLASSSAVWGRSPGLLEENTPVAPHTPYGVAKAAMEQRAAELAAARGVRLCSLRIGNVAGLDAALGGWSPATVMDRFPDGRTPRRCYIGPATLARVLAALCRRAAAPEGLPAVLNVAQPGAVEMGALLRAAGLPFACRPAPPEAIAELALDTGLLARLLPAGVPLPPGDPAALAAEWAAFRQLPQARAATAGEGAR